MGNDFACLSARFYHPTLCCWLTPDPLAHDTPSVSPYAYCAGNPVKYIDPDGCRLDWYFNQDGFFLGQDDAPTDNVRIMDKTLWEIFVNENTRKIDAGTGQQFSVLFSQARMDDEATLNVYRSINEMFDITNEDLVMDKTLKPGTLMRTRGTLWIDPVTSEVISDEVRSMQIAINHSRQGMLQYNIADNIYNIASVLDHENNHTSGWRAGAKAYGTIEKSLKEQQAYLYQMTESPFWEKTTSRFKIEIQRLAKKYIQP